MLLPQMPQQYVHVMRPLRPLFVIRPALDLTMQIVGPAVAAPRRNNKSVDTKKEKAARADFEQAEKAFNVGRFDEALRHYQAAYDQLPLPAFLFNIAQCHRNLGNHERALFFY